MWRYLRRLVRWIEPSRIRLDYLYDLAKYPDPEDSAKKVLDWHFEVYKLVVQAVLAFVGAFLVAFLVALAKDELRTSLWLSLLIAFGVTGSTSALAMLAYWRIRRLDRDFVYALRLIDAFKNN